MYILALAQVAVVYILALAQVAVVDAALAVPKKLGPELVLGKRVDASRLTLEAFRELYEGRVPVVLFNVFKGLDSDAWCEGMVEALKDEVVEYDSRDELGELESYEAPFSEFLSALPENSDHLHSMYLMSEDILTTASAAPLAEQLSLPDELFGSDLFQHFPAPVRPKTALIIGGAGARSFLHADPFEWVGYNILLEGQKVWTFLPPDVSMDAIEGRRNAPDAWGEYNLTAGWVSDLDLYYNLGASPAAQPDTLGAGKRKKKGDAGAKAAAAPAPEPSALYSHFLSAYQAKQQQQKQPQGPPLPFRSGPGDLPVETALTASQISRSCQIVQSEGEMVIIPPAWWHQVYHLRPSIAVAGQYCNDFGKERMFRHMLRWCNQGSEGSDEQATVEATGEEMASSLTADEREAQVEAELRGLPLLPSEREQVMRVIERGLEWRLGAKKGKAALESLKKAP